MPTPAPSPIPEGLNTVTTYLWFNGNCGEAIAFYEKAFGSNLPFPAALGPDGKQVMHAMITVGDTNIMMADVFDGQWEHGPKEGATAGLWVYVEDSDAFFGHAVDAGCEVLMPVEDMFWGDRFGKVKDPFGHCWGIATHKWVFTPEEMQQQQQG